jgi:hypothetical protein
MTNVVNAIAVAAVMIRIRFIVPLYRSRTAFVDVAMIMTS